MTKKLCFKGTIPEGRYESDEECYDVIIEKQNKVLRRIIRRINQDSSIDRKKHIVSIIMDEVEER